MNNSSLIRRTPIRSVLVNRTTGNVIDGHARVKEALTAGCTVPSAPK